jgi:hypothetical protein
MNIEYPMSNVECPSNAPAWDQHSYLATYALLAKPLC